MQKKIDKGPGFRFMAIFNRWGTALASNLPGAIFHLYENPDVVLIYDPSSELNLERFINDFKIRVFSDPPVTVKDVVVRFNYYLNSDEGISKIGKEKKQEIIFIGFDCNNIYPLEIRCGASEDSDGKIELKVTTEKKINSTTTAFISTSGGFDYVMPVIEGISPDFEAAIKKRIYNGITKFQNKLIQKAQRLDSEFNAPDIKESFMQEESLRILSHSRETCYSDSILGLETFSVEEMGDAIENFINTEARFSNLKYKRRNRVNLVCERAVMTIPEGFTWIKQKKTV